MQTRRKWSIGAIIALSAVFLVGCSRDPEAAKKKYLARGNSYLQEGKYSEAAIEYRNAIQIDSRFAEAHYQLAQ